jgi:elongation factor G
VEVGPADEGVAGLQFIDEVKGGNIPREFIPSVEKGFRQAMSNGVLAGYPVDSLKVRLIDGSYHNVDSDQLSFELAAKMAFRTACKKAGSVLLEPVMKLEVVTPEEYVGDVVGDINRSRGHLAGLSSRATCRLSTHRCPCRKCSAMLPPAYPYQRSGHIHHGVLTLPGNSKEYCG